MSTTSSSENWVLGVTLGLLGSIAINTGNNVQSLGLKELKEREQHGYESSKGEPCCIYFCREQRKTSPSNDSDETMETGSKLVTEQKKVHPSSSITWIVGTIIFVTGSLLNFASYAFTAQSMLASLESIQFVTNLIFGKFMLKANVSNAMLIGTGLTVMGTVLAVQFSSPVTLNLSTEEMKDLYSNPAYIIYLTLMIGLLFLLNHMYNYYEKRKALGEPLRYSGAVIPLSYSIWSALFGTQSVVQAKVLAELLSVHSSGVENIFHSWFTYTTIMTWILTVGVWLSRLNNALTKFDPLLIIPLLQCSFIFFAIVSGGIFFKEFNEFTVTQWIGFWCGVLVMFSGLILLTPVPRKVDEEQLSKEVATLLRSKAETAISNRDDSPTKCSQEGPMIPIQSMLPLKTGTISEEMAYSHSIKRSPRPSISQTAVSQMNAMKDAVIESANMFLAPPTGTNAITDAMVDAAKMKEEASQRKDRLKVLQELLNQNDEQTKERILSRDVLELIYDLGLEEHVTKYGVPPMMKELEELRDELGSPRTFRDSMLKKASDMEKTLNDSFRDCEVQAEIPALT